MREPDDESFDRRLRELFNDNYKPSLLWFWFFLALVMATGAVVLFWLGGI